MATVSIIKLVDSDIFRTWKERFNLSIDSIASISSIVNTSLQSMSNTSIGVNSIPNNSSAFLGTFNTSIGSNTLSGSFSTQSGLKVVSKNTVIGADSGILMEGSSNSVLGRFSGNGSFYNGDALNATQSNNSIILSDGDGKVGLFIKSNGFVGIGIDPLQQLHVKGNIAATGTISASNIDATTLGSKDSAFYRNPSNLTSVVPVSKGGTGVSTLPLSGAIPIGKTNGSYAISRLTSGNGIAITNGDGSITIENTGVISIGGKTGVLSDIDFKGDKGDKGDRGDVGPPGPPGPQGPSGLSTIIKKPKIVSHVDGQQNVGLRPEFVCTAFEAEEEFFVGKQDFQEWQLSKSPTFDTIVKSVVYDINSNGVVAGSTIVVGIITAIKSVVFDLDLDLNTTYYVRVKHGSDLHRSSWSDPIRVKTVASLPIEYNISVLYDGAQNNSIPEGTQVTWKITAKNFNKNFAPYNLNTNVEVPAANKLFYRFSSVQTSDFVNNEPLSGPLIISGAFTDSNGVQDLDTGSIVRTFAVDLVNEGIDSVRFEIRTGSVNGPVVASSTIMVTDIYTVETNKSVYDEGEVVTITATSNSSVVGNETLAFEIQSISSSTNAADFDGNTLEGTIVLTSSNNGLNPKTGTATIKIKEDQAGTDPNQTETFRVLLKSNNTNTGTILARSGTKTIRNTSLEPEYKIVSDKTVINEGDSIEFTVTSRIVKSGVLYYTIVPPVFPGNVPIDSFDLSDGALSGSVTLLPNSDTLPTFGIGKFTKILRADLTTDGTEAFRIQLRSDSVTGPVLAENSVDILVRDTSTTFIPPAPTPPAPSPVPVPVSPPPAPPVSHPVGEISFFGPGIYEWIVPNNVTKISAVAIGAGGIGVFGSNGISYGGGGGALDYENSFSVVPGTKMEIFIGESFLVGITQTYMLYRNSNNLPVYIVRAAGGSSGAEENGSRRGQGGRSGSSSFGNGGNGAVRSQTFPVGLAGTSGGYISNGFGVNSATPLGSSLFGISQFDEFSSISGFGGGSLHPDRPQPGAIRIIWGDNRSFPYNAR